MQMREKVGKSGKTVFFQWFVAPEGRKVGSLKRRVRSHLARWEMKKCTPLWREAHFEVKMYRTHHSRTTFGSWDVEKVHAVVARSTFRSQKCKKHTSFGPLLLVEMSKKCTPLWREAHFEVKMHKKHHVRTTFWRFRCRFAWQAQRIVHLLKSEENVRVFVTFPKTICKDAFSAAGAVQETCSWETLGLLGGESGRIASFFLSSSSKTEEVSQNCFVFDVVKFKKWRKSRRIAWFSSC